MTTYAELLDNPSITRQYLAIFTPVDGTGANPFYLYFSTHGFRSGASDSPPSTLFEARLKTPINFTDKMFSGNNIFGGTSTSFGDIEINNADGALDDYLELAWDGTQVDIYLGGLDFDLNDYELVQSAIIQDVIWNLESISIKLRDRRAELEGPVQEEVYEVASGVDGNAKPLVFGKVYNIQPTLVDETNLIYEYAYNPAGTPSLDAVYFNGVLATLTTDYTDNGDGTFTLTGDPLGRVTCDVETTHGSITYTGTAANLIKSILTHKAGFVWPDDFDETAFDALDSTTPADTSSDPSDWTMGVYINDTRITFEQVLDYLAASVGAYWTFTQENKLTLKEIKLATSSKDIDETLIKTIKRTRTPIPAHRVTCGYAKNYTVMAESEIGATSTRKQFSQFEYRYVYQESTDVSDAHQSRELAIDGAWTVSVPPQHLATRLLAYFGDDQNIYEVVCQDAGTRVQLGDTITLQHSRFNLDTDYLVIGTAYNSRTSEVKLTLLGDKDATLAQNLVDTQDVYAYGNTSWVLYGDAEAVGYESATSPEMVSAEVG